ncbi:MAG: hypothetical protein M5U08_13300 [Burkholderiales bacterium]|nr:hypothetical protein [Burkholderiales bacterium]
MAVSGVRRERSLEARGRLAGGRREADREPRAARQVDERGQDTRDRRGLAGARPARDHGEAAQASDGRGDLLCIVRLARVGKQPVERSRQPRGIAPLDPRAPREQCRG